MPSLSSADKGIPLAINYYRWSSYQRLNGLASMGGSTRRVITSLRERDFEEFKERMESLMGWTLRRGEETAGNADFINH